jgi:hypothetical protein
MTYYPAKLCNSGPMQAARLRQHGLLSLSVSLTTPNRRHEQTSYLVIGAVLEIQLGLF